LLLEITAFLRETYQYMPKKINAISNQVSQISKIFSKENKPHYNSFITNNNDSNNPSTVGNVYVNTNSNENTSFHNLNNQETNEMNYNEKLTNQSNENINMSLGGEPDHARHISFKFQYDTADNDLSQFNSSQRRNTAESNEILNPENTSRLSIQNNKRSSFNKSFNRPSLKYKLDRTSTRTSSNHAHIQRKSTIASISNHEQDTVGNLSENASINEPNEMTHNEGLKPGFASVNNSSINSSFYDHDVCEIDEVDYNKCFPWIKVNDFIFFVYYFKTLFN
jgi:hypothetical protein